MTTLLVTQAGNAGKRLDRDCYIGSHLSLVRDESVQSRVVPLHR